MSDVPRSLQSGVSTIQTGRTHRWHFSTFTENMFFIVEKRQLWVQPFEWETTAVNTTDIIINKCIEKRQLWVEHARTIFCVKLSINNHIVGLVHKHHTYYTNASDVPRSLQSWVSTIHGCTHSWRFSTFLVHKNHIIRTCLMYHGAKLSFNHSNGRTHSWRSSTFS